MFKIANYPYLNEKTGDILPLLEGDRTILDLINIGEPIPYVSLYEWFSTKARVLEGTIASDWNDTDTTGLELNPELIQTLYPNTVLMIGDEYIKVKSVDISNNTIEVYRRGDLNSTASAHSAGETVYVISNAEKEGEITSNFIGSIKERYENYIQEFTEKIVLSKRAVNASLKSYEDLVLEERQEKIESQIKKLQLAILYGRKFKPSVTDEDYTADTMGGIKQFIQEGNGVIATGALDQTNFDAFLVALANRESEADVLLVNPYVKQKIANLNTFQDFLTQQGRDAYMGYNLIGVVSNPGNGRVLEVITSPLVRTNEIFAIRKEDLTFYPIKDKTTKGTLLLDLAEETNTTSAVLDETLRTQGTLEVKNPDRMGIFVIS